MFIMWSPVEGVVSHGPLGQGTLEKPSREGCLGSQPFRWAGHLPRYFELLSGVPDWKGSLKGLGWGRVGLC